MRFEVESRLDDLFGETESTDANEGSVSDDLFSETESADANEESALDDLFGEKESANADEEPVLDDLFSEERETHTNHEPISNERVQNNFLEEEEIEVLEIHEEGIEMSESHPLDDLKSTVLSIDWEITDEVMGRFVDQVEDLKREFADNKIYLLFLQLLGSVGVYIKTKRGKADPDAFKVLGSAFKAFDDVVSSNTMPDPEKKKRLAVELDKFKELKKKIAAKKAAKKKTEIIEPKHVQELPVEEKKSKPIREEEPVELLIEDSIPVSNTREEVAEIVLNPVGEKQNINSQDIIREVLVEMKKFIRGEFDDLREELRLRKKRR
jgi:hypothetical protein